MKAFQTDFRAQQAPTFPIALVMCAVRKALRPFLQHPHTQFTAVLEVPPGIDDLFYHQAAVELLTSTGQYDEHGNDISYVARVDEIEFVHALRKILGAQRVVLLCKDLDALSADLRIVADFEAVLDRPTPAHFMAAARMTRLSGMSRDDAEFLADLDFNKVKMVVGNHRSLRSAISRLRRTVIIEKGAPQQSKPDPEPKMTLREMAGYGEAAKWGLQLADDLASWQAGKIGWEDVDRGAVLYGEPGTGKTTYGRLLAATCGIPIIEASSARWQSTGHLGDMLKAMRKSFEMAAKAAPCILFLDEIDAFGDRGSNPGDDNHDYKRQVINAVLECLDPPGGRQGVVVIAATNSPEVLDPALLRPGRLERLIRVPLPDGPTRVAILKHHLRGSSVPNDLQQFVELSVGYAGAHIEMIAREARRRARRDGRRLTEQHLLDAFPPSRPLTDDELRRVGTHEAGHAIVAVVATSDELLSVFVNRRVQLGDAASSLGHIEYRRQERVFETEESLSARIAVHMAGIAAERIAFGHHSTSGGGARTSDLHVATEVATRLEGQFGFGGSLVLDLGSGPLALETMRVRDPRLWRAVDTRLRQSLERAETILRENRPVLEMVARRLIESGVVTGSEVRELVSVPALGHSRPNASQGTHRQQALAETLRQEARG